MLQFKDRRLVIFGTHVKAIREGKGLSLVDVSQNSSLSKSDLASIEEGGKNFGFTTLLELAKSLDISPSQLLDIDFTD